MRSGFLNATSASDSPALSLDKGSRNKRKFRTDQQQQTAASPMPAPLCAHSGEGIKIGAYLGDTCGSAAMDHLSSNGIDAAGALPGTNGQNFMPSDHMNHHSCHPSLVSALLSHTSSHPPEVSLGFSHSKEGQDYCEVLQDSDWDRFSEARLEEILMSMLDGIYKDAVRRITSLNFTQEEALAAVLRSGRWNKRDALTSIVDTALAWLQNSETRGSSRDTVFSDLKEMESYVLAEMVCMLRKVRPHLTKGDAMWSLLMCDLNVLLACTIEDDGAPSSVKEGIAPSIVVAQSKQPTDLVLSNVPLTAPTTVAPLLQQTPCLPSSTMAQPLNVSLSSNKDSRSAFSIPSFSSSPTGKVSVACHKGGSSKLPLPMSGHTATVSTKIEPVTLSQEQALHSMGAVNPRQDSLPQLSVIDEQATKLELQVPHSSTGHVYSEKCCSWKPDDAIPRVASSEASPAHTREAQVTNIVPSRPHLPDALTKSLGTGHRTTLQPGSTGSRSKGNKFHSSPVPLPSHSKQPVHTDLQIGTNNIPGFQVPSMEGWLTSSVSSDVGSLASSGAELSLGSVATVNTTTSTDLLSEAQLDKAPDDNYIKYASSQILGCIDSTAEERKTVMLWQLVGRVKYLEVQLQDWTDWAQQKVMQAARRLTKDAAELKALRQERDEYMRLRKEKQALEESTMKKLAEMETSLGKALSQVDRANATAWRLEAENTEVRKEMEAAKATAAESIYVCQEATKREKKSTKKVQGWEKQKLKLQEELLDGKQNLSNLLELLSQARERHQQAEARWRHEKNAKEEAQQRAGTEKQAKELAEQAAKRREEALQRKVETQSQRYRDEVQKLESGIAKVKLSLGLQPSILTLANGYRMAPSNLDSCSAEKLKQINARLQAEIADLQQSQMVTLRKRGCIMCSGEEMSVVFLPCAHQVICMKCNDIHQKKGYKECPSCRTLIQQRIRVYGVRM